MREVVSTMDRFQGFDIPVAGKPVRHSRTDMPIMVCLLVMRHMMIRKLPSQYELPTVTIHNAATAARNVISYYYKETSMKDIKEMKAAGANGNIRNSVAD